MNLKLLPSSALAWIRRTRCKCLLVMTLLGLVLRENYPVSNFPMYSSFIAEAYYLYLTNAEGTPLATRRFGLTAYELKKIFDRHGRKELKRYRKSEDQPVLLAEEAAGRSLLAYLDDISAGNSGAKKLLAGLQVRYVLIAQHGDELRQETRIVAQHA
jgi:hypothetical protein